MAPAMPRWWSWHIAPSCQRRWTVAECGVCLTALGQAVLRQTAPLSSLRVLGSWQGLRAACAVQHTALLACKPSCLLVLGLPVQGHRLSPACRPANGPAQEVLSRASSMPLSYASADLASVLTVSVRGQRLPEASSRYGDHASSVTYTTHSAASAGLDSAPSEVPTGSLAASVVLDAPVAAAELARSEGTSSRASTQRTGPTAAPRAPNLPAAAGQQGLGYAPGHSVQVSAGYASTVSGYSTESYSSAASSDGDRGDDGRHDGDDASESASELGVSALDSTVGGTSANTSFHQHRCGFLLLSVQTVVAADRDASWPLSHQKTAHQKCPTLCRYGANVHEDAYASYGDMYAHGYAGFDASVHSSAAGPQGYAGARMPPGGRRAASARSSDIDRSLAGGSSCLSSAGLHDSQHSSEPDQAQHGGGAVPSTLASTSGSDASASVDSGS